MFGIILALYIVMNNIIQFLILVMLIGPLAGNTYGQEADFDQIAQIVKSGNAKEFVKKFHTSVELNINGEEATYSKSQAEAVLKDYFDKNPPKSFEINHQGASKGGIPYAIGAYTSEGATFRVFIRLRKTGNQYLIFEMSFIKD